MKKLIVFCFVLTRISGNGKEVEVKKINSAQLFYLKEQYYNWPGPMDTLETNVFCTKAKRRLFY